MVQGRLVVEGTLCSADHMASMLDQLSSLAALGMQDVTLDLSRVTSLSESAMDAILELAVEASPAWLKVRLDGWPPLGAVGAPTAQ
jgi:anti-anti-sigma regulatory factor